MTYDPRTALPFPTRLVVTVATPNRRGSGRGSGRGKANELSTDRGNLCLPRGVRSDRGLRGSQPARHAAAASHAATSARASASASSTLDMAGIPAITRDANGNYWALVPDSRGIGDRRPPANMRQRPAAADAEAEGSWWFAAGRSRRPARPRQPDRKHYGQYLRPGARGLHDPGQQRGAVRRHAARIIPADPDSFAEGLTGSAVPARKDPQPVRRASLAHEPAWVLLL